MLKRMRILAGLPGGAVLRAAGLAALAAAALALAGGAAFAEDGGRRAVSTRGDGRGSRSGSASRSGGGASSPSRGVARSGPSSGSVATAGRHAVQRSGANGVRRQVGSGGGHHGGGGHGGHGGTVVIGGWYDPWWYGYGPYYGYGWGWGGWGGWGWGGPWYYGAPYYGAPAGVAGGGGAGYGALDLDLWPDDVQVYIDGDLVGEVDEFDGFPTFLWLPAGTYDVAFYRDGFVTLARQYSIYAGQVIDVNDRLQRGESVLPENLASTSTVNREARMERNRQRQAEARQYEEWRERAQYETVEPEAEAAEVEVEEEEPEQRVESGTMARLRLSVTPEDASLYLDGNFLGSAREVAHLSAGMVVPPGRHVLEVVRPGYEAEELHFEGVPGQEVSLQVELEEE